ncbi:hypothetical protein [Sorangium sp. So ce1078]|uniref:hypothetical protein n=1 Tax=Sorangium sp. So ce1078 TaxID=3133329 RepID=UPI003F5E28E8
MQIVVDRSTPKTSGSASRTSRARPPAPMHLPRRAPPPTRPPAEPVRASLERAFGADLFADRAGAARAPRSSAPPAGAPRVDTAASEALAQKPAEGAERLLEAASALAAALPGAAGKAAPPKLDWETHPANLRLSERVAVLEERYPGLKLRWVIDWARRFIEQVVAKADATPADKGVFDDRLEQMAKELAARIDATNPQLRAGGAAPQKGISGGAGTHLWTGGIDYKAAQAAARRAAEAESQAGNLDAASVEMTIAGELLDSINFSGNGIDYAPEADKLWNELSRAFAGNARGTVRVHTLYGVRSPSIFYSVESLALLLVLKAQEAREKAGKKQDGPVVDEIRMVIYFRKGEVDPETGQLAVPKDESGKMTEELVKQREDRVTTSYQLERARANAWDKALAWEPTFAVAGSVKHRAALLDARRAAASPR